jgi:hypothetical protein
MRTGERVREHISPTMSRRWFLIGVLVLGAEMLVVAAGQPSVAIAAIIC